MLLAHLGGFAPAQSAIIQITPKIASRLGTGDDMLANASTFYKEMKEAVVITRDIVPQSLILIDELGRGYVQAKPYAWRLVIEFVFDLENSLHLH